MFIVNQYHHSIDAYIERWSMDGHFLQTVVSDKITNPNSLVVDSIIDRIYWSDGVYRYIHTAKLDGTDRKSIASGLTSVNNIAVFQNMIYFTIVSHQIFHKERFKTDGVPTLANHNSGFVHDLIFNSTAMQPHSTDPCHNSSCLYACLPSSNATSSCACPPQSTIQGDNVTCTSKWPLIRRTMVINVDTGITSCSAGTRLCNVTGLCLPANALCNRYNDCPDGSDESDCGECDNLFTVCSVDVNCVITIIAMVSFPSRLL